MKYRAICVVFVLSALLSGCGGFDKHRSFGNIAYVTGTARVFGTAKGSWGPAENGTPVFSRDSIETSKGSETVVAFGNNSIKLNESTRITINDTFDGRNKRLVAVLNTGGEVLSDVKDIERHGALYEVWTPTAVAHAEGTRFVVAFSPQPYVTNVRVLDGRVRVFNPFLPSAPQVLVSPGCYTTVACNAGPVAAVPMNYGQFKKMQRLLGPQSYHDYEIRFKVNPEEMVLDAPIVVVPIVPPVFFPPGPPLPRGPHGRFIVAAPFLLPPLPPPGIIAPVPPLPPAPVGAPHSRVIARVPPPLPPGLPPPPPLKVSPRGMGPAHALHPRIVGVERDRGRSEQRNNSDDGGRGRHKGGKR